MNQGWECPKCARVYAPFVNVCAVCNAKVLTTRQLAAVDIVTNARLARHGIQGIDPMFSVRQDNGGY